MTDKNYQIMRLSSGEEIICNLVDDTHPRTFGIETPLRINAIPRVTRTGIEESISLQRWVHFPEEEIFQINKSQIVIMTTASAGLSRFYDHCVMRMKADYRPIDEPREYEPTDEELEEIEAEERWERFGNPDSKLIH